jgi:hypothetical protein
MNGNILQKEGRSVGLRLKRELACAGIKALEVVRAERDPRGGAYRAAAQER